MKKLFILLAVFALTATTVYGATKIKKIEVYQNDFFATISTSGKELKIYRVIDDKTTCYVMVDDKTPFTQMQCVK